MELHGKGRHIQIVNSLVRPIVSVDKTLPRRTRKRLGDDGIAMILTGDVDTTG